MPDGGVAEFPDDASDAEIEALINGAAPDVASTAAAHKAALEAPPPKPKEKPLMDRIVEAGSKLDPINIVRGQTKGAIGTAYHVGKMLGIIPENKDFEAALESENAGEGLGKFTEQAAEFAGGEGAANALVKSASLPAKVVKGAAVGGAITAAQGGDAKMGATIGGAAPVVAKGIELIAKPISDALLEGAKKSYARALGATKERMKNVANKVVSGYDSAGTKVPGLIDRGVRAWTRKGLDAKAAEAAADFGDQIDNLWSNLPKDEAIPAKPIRDAIDAAKSTFEEEVVKTIQQPTSLVNSQGQRISIPVTGPVKTAVEPQQVRNLERIGKIVDGMTDDNGLINVHRLRRVKGLWDKIVAQKGGYAGANLSLADNAGVLSRKEGANAVREELAKRYPNIAVINKELHFWSDVQDVLEETLRRTSSQSQPMGQQLGRVGGMAAAGGKVVKAIFTGEVVANLRKVTTSAAWNTTSAVAKNRLARALASGSAQRTTTVLKQIALAQQSQSSKKKAATN
jgi:hypothetical protein